MFSRTKLVCLATVVGMAAFSGWQAQAQGPAVAPTNDLPNPYQTISDYFKLPAGRTWGSTSAVDIDKDGRSIWVAERSGANTCLDRATNTIQNVPTILKFDQSGKLVTSFGAGLLIFPHGIHVDKDGNIWVTDGNDNAPAPERGAAPGGAGAERGRGAPVAPKANAAATKGHQVFKFSPDGKVLMTLGKPGGDNAPGYFFQPNDVITNDAGEIFVSEGHASIPGTTARILKFDKTGKLIKEWGTYGSADGQLNQPHALAFDSKGRLFVGDRGNNQVIIFDQNGTFIARWPQFSRPSGIYIDKRTDTLYVADSESGSVNPAHGAWKRGIRIGSAVDGKVVSFIPDPSGAGVTFSMQDGKPVLTTADGKPGPTGTLAAEGVVVDNAGNVYGAEVGPRQVKKYVKK